jgi:hypothetical protein
MKHAGLHTLLSLLAPLALPLAASTAACVRAPRMCVPGPVSGCGAGSTCVAGRCLSTGATAAIATATRVLYDPVDTAYLRPGEQAATTGLATIGRGDGAFALFRFAVPLSAQVTVVEAYLLLEPPDAVDLDPAPVTLRTERVVGDWSSDTSWARRPALQDMGLPETRVEGGSRVVRLEVRALVERWRKRARDEMGVAVVADAPSASRTGVAFVLPARLELYLK